MQNRALTTTMLEDWLAPLNTAAVECDGMTRLISILLRREKISHEIKVGSLSVENAGTMPIHYWVELPDYGWTIDLRARMWFPGLPEVPHGAFDSAGIDDSVTYLEHQGIPNPLPEALPDEAMFFVLAMQPLEAYPRLPSP